MRFEKSSDLAALSEAIMDEVPSAAPRSLENGNQQASITVGQVSEGVIEILPLFPDVDMPAVAAVVYAHDEASVPRPTPNPWFWLRDKLLDDSLTPQQKINKIARFADFMGKNDPDITD